MLNENPSIAAMGAASSIAETASASSNAETASLSSNASASSEPEGSCFNPVNLVSPVKMSATPKKKSPESAESLLNDADTIIYEPCNFPSILKKVRKLNFPKKKPEEGFVDALAKEYGVPPTDKKALSNATCSKKKAMPEPTAPVSQNKNSLKHRYPTFKELRLATLNHSLQQGHQCMLDPKLSSGNKKVFACCSCVSKKADPLRPENLSACPYRVVYNKRTKKGRTWWRRNISKCVLAHKLDCSSPGIVRTEQLCADSSFSKMIVDDKSISLTNLQRAALQPGIAKTGLKSHTLYRAKHQTLKQDARFYEADFCKLREWGREYCKLVPVTVSARAKFLCLHAFWASVHVVCFYVLAWERV